MDFQQFSQACDRFHLEARRCHETHWQIRYMDRLVAEVWPTTRRWVPAVRPIGAKARDGTPLQAIDYAAATIGIHRKSGSATEGDARADVQPDEFRRMANSCLDLASSGEISFGVGVVTITIRIPTSKLTFSTK